MRHAVTAKIAGIAVAQYSNWRHFKSEFIYDLFDSDTFRQNHFLFRGQRDANWPLESSFDRWFRELDLRLDRIDTANGLLSQFKKEGEGLDILEEIGVDDIKTLALGQHFGLPTRLLDWSESPYIAAFFAFSDFISAGQNEELVAIWALNLKSKAWTLDSGVEIVDVPAFGNLRLRNQAGKFSLSKTIYGCLEDYVLHCGIKGDSLIKLLLPAQEAKVALADLYSMGINHSRIYPEIVGCAMAAKMRVLLDSLS
jgi:hypothetical protein